MTALVWRVAPALDDGSAAALRVLWQRDPQRNPFASPAFLQAMAGAVPAGDRPVWALGTAGDGTLDAAWALRLDGGRTLRFLPFDYSDQRTCLASDVTDAATMGQGLASAIRESGAMNLALTNVPLWGPTMAAARAALGEVGWVYRAFPAWPCPVLRVAAAGSAGGPQALRKEIDRHKRVRGYANALQRQSGYSFDVATTVTDLTTWHRAFCDAHEARWAGTDTPSVYRSEDARALFLAALSAWHADDVLLRFTLCIDAGPLAFVAALRSGTRLVYHHVATSPAGERHRAGHVLIRLIGLWMSEHGLDTLDFGAGGEDYKARYATVDEPLWRLFAAPRRLSRMYVRGLVEERIRGSTVLQQGWDRWINRGLRGAWRRRRTRSSSETTAS